MCAKAGEVVFRNPMTGYELLGESLMLGDIINCEDQGGCSISDAISACNDNEDCAGFTFAPLEESGDRNIGNYYLVRDKSQGYGYDSGADCYEKP